MSSIFGDTFIPTDDGYWVSEAHMRIAEIIRDYDPKLRLAWIPPDKRTDPNEPSFAVIEQLRNGGESILMRVEEHEVDHRLLARIFNGDTAKNDVISWARAEEAARKAIELKRKMEEREEQAELAKSILKSPLSVFRHDGKEYRE